MNINKEEFDLKHGEMRIPFIQTTFDLIQAIFSPQKQSDTNRIRIKRKMRCPPSDEESVQSSVFTQYNWLADNKECGASIHSIWRNSHAFSC